MLDQISNHKKRKIWIISCYDALPGEAGFQHSLNLVSALSKDFEVIFWNSDFSHATKTKRKNLKEIKLCNNAKINIIETIEYKKNISFKRALSLVIFYYRMFKEFNNLDKPDVIIKGFPDHVGEIFLLIAKWKYRFKIILDFRDLWPEIFHSLLPRKLYFLGYITFSPLYLIRFLAFRYSDGCVSVSKNYNEIAARFLKHSRKNNCFISYHSNMTLRTDLASINDIEQKKFQSSFNFLYAGNLGEKYDLDCILNTFDQVLRINKQVKLHIAGDGPLKELILESANKNQNIVYHGLLTKNELFKLYKNTRVALVPYHHSSSVSMPAKAYELMFHGIPVITSNRLEYAELVSQNNLGKIYQSGNKESLLEAINFFLNFKNKYMDLASNSLALAPQFDHQEQIKVYRQAINTTLGSKN